MRRRRLSRFIDKLCKGIGRNEPPAANADGLESYSTNATEAPSVQSRNVWTTWQQLRCLAQREQSRSNRGIRHRSLREVAIERDHLRCNATI
jgi:hypothetical protein